MKKLILLILFVGFFSCEKTELDPTGLPIEKSMEVLSALPVPDHIIFVWLENKNYSQIINSPSAPFINSLILQGTLFTNDHALGHPSYPEYIRFFAGTTNGKKNDNCITGTPYGNANLYTQLKAKGKSFAWYSEDLPSTGSRICSSGAYAEKHNPTQCFSNVPASSNKKWSDFPANYDALETVVCISPNLNHDMHNGSISLGDNWINDHLGNLVTWCKTHNSVFVVYFDEDNGTTDNHLPVIAVGEPVKANYKSNIHYDHYNWTRTILALYGATQIANSKYRQTITDCWK